ncbi:hypothetical protein D187_007918 [Cystobacter fuscus DSM 2262]|uniref:Uncharacterized protein n=1 Tax=Cystobacter fuscus (strain ATCC 25194 / DSM 2262 / NBRC 100088 / M29) TaxID=1242864 RepID=S9P0E8_CYSF2|nr:hypothetical protein D187_007918 [Cystobacter fuscus DSM 2262]
MKVGKDRLSEVIQYTWIFTPVFQPREEIFPESATYGVSVRGPTNSLDIEPFMPLLDL